MIKISKINSISLQDFDDLVVQTYGRPYCFQQQDDCKPRGVEYFSVPNSHPFDYENDSVAEEVNGPEMGVSFKAWLARDPLQKLNTKDTWDREHGLTLFWERNFYPSLEILTQDLFEKGLLPAGDYQIVIDW